MKLDVLALEAHPDDVELACAGTLIKLKALGYRVGVVALTRAELGTRGDSRTRLTEFRASASVMGLDAWGVLDIPDGSIEVNPTNRWKVTDVIRKYQPDLIFAPYWNDRHPDHANASRLIREAAFHAGLAKVRTQHPPHRPRTIVYYPSYFEFQPSFIVDVSITFEKKLEAIRCYRSQFHVQDAPRDGEPETLLSRPDFIEFIITRARYWGSKIGAAYGEPFYWPNPVPVEDPVRTFASLSDLR